ncbi:nucleic acid-binding protein [Scytonema hofmannii PCC 7110]|uniref:Nucleic acid-binding protein n=1 Tax=Scytonema hofmannii PCC 7110 TaxID=128403 RepID=A0A139X8Y9_9CYAN|nr:DUF3368 domain-containing protein [Scytonema hofmannii]KYC41168.1 nucleic acid-binding protein [Scytonema hofmannii PCC 7110]
MIVVSNTSPLIGLATIGQLNLLQQLYSNIIIPQAVYDEITALDTQDACSIAVQTFTWIQTTAVTNSAIIATFPKKLDLGETEAIALAMEIGADLLLIDDESGRKVARSLGIKLIGVLGVLIRAKRMGLIAAVKPVMDRLIVEAGYWIDNNLYNEVLQQVGE